MTPVVDAADTALHTAAMFSFAACSMHTASAVGSGVVGQGVVILLEPHRR